MDSALLSFWWFDIALAHIIVAIGFVVSSWLLTRTVHEKKLSLTFLTDHIVLFSLSALFFGRVGSMIFIYPAISEKMLSTKNFIINIVFFDFFKWEPYIQNILNIDTQSLFFKPAILIQSFFSFWHGGIDFFWAIGSFLLLFLFLCTIKNEHPLAWLDAFSLPTVLFLIFFSFAAFFAGWNYGSPVSDGYWFAISYPDNNEIQYSGSIHPVQLYAASLFFLFFIISAQIWSKKIREEWPSGIFGSILISSLFFILAFLEFFRGDASYKILDFFPLPSFVFLGIGLTIIIFMIIRGHFHVLSQFKKIISQ